MLTGTTRILRVPVSPTRLVRPAEGIILSKPNLKQIIRAKYHTMMQEAHRDHAHQALVNTCERDLIVDTVEEGLVLRDRFEPALMLSDLMSLVDELKRRNRASSKIHSKPVSK